MRLRMRLIGQRRAGLVAEAGRLHRSWSVAAWSLRAT